MFKCCIVGFGPMGVRHAEAIAGSTEFQLVCVVDSNPRIAAKVEKFGAAFESQFNRVDLSKLDVLIICTNGPSHAALLSASVGCVPFILCEKPFTNCTSDAQRIAVLARESGKTRIAVNHVRRLHPWYLKLRECILSGAKSCEISANLPGGLAINGLHFVDIARFLFQDDPKTVYCERHAPKKTNPRGAQFIDPNGFCRLSFSGERALNLFCNEDNAAPPQVTIKFADRIWNLIETLGCVSGGRVQVSEQGRRFEHDVDAPKFEPALNLVDLSRAALRNLVSADDVFCAVDDGVATIHAFSLMNLSADSGRRVDVSSVPPGELQRYHDIKWAIT